MNWWSILKAYFGTTLKQEDVSTWEFLLSDKSVTAEELVKVIKEAGDRGEKTIGYHATVRDVAKWIDGSRNGWPANRPRSIN
jgi:hypothetical protein